MRLLVSLSLVAVFATTAAAHATTFTDGFAGGTPGLGVTTAGNFNTIDGSNVDLLGPGPYQNYGNLCAVGISQCVDMGGTGGNTDGDLVSNTAFAAGTYGVSFDLTGNERSGSSETEVFLGSTLIGDYTLTVNEVENFSGLVSTTGGVLQFEAVNASNQGTILNSASVATPEPSSLVLLGSGLLTSAGMMFKRRKR